MAKTRILFICTGNSARSQMAEAFARYYGGDLVQVDSAGTDPKGIHEYTSWAMNEVGIDISNQSSDALDSKDLSQFDVAVTLCGDARDNCPSMPAGIRTEHWDLPDPARARGQPLERLRAFRVVRLQIERRVKDLLQRLVGVNA